VGLAAAAVTTQQLVRLAAQVIHHQLLHLKEIMALQVQTTGMAVAVAVRVL
jgi:hypothetical protein